MKKILCLLTVLCGVTIHLYGLSVSNLRVNSVKNPIGLDNAPRFSWILESEERGCFQETYRIIIYKDLKNGEIVYDSGDIEGDNTVNVEANGFQISPATRYYWTVTVRDNRGNIASSDEGACFVTGLIDTGWNGAQWIKSVANEGMPRFRKTIQVDKEIKQAWLYSSALGVYDLKINGKRVGHIQQDGSTIYEELKPGWTDYRKTINYSMHDVKSYFQNGENILGASLANGWWKGNISVGTYGKKPLALIAKLHIIYVDNTSEVIVTDNTWESNNDGALLLGDIWDGEEYDATKESDWTITGMPSGLWTPCEVSSDFEGKIVSLLGSEVYALKDFHQPVKSVKIYSGIKNTGTEYGEIDVTDQYDGFRSFLLKKGQIAILDFGQNLVGWTPFVIKGAKGTHLRIRYAEMLNDTGSGDRGNDGPGGSLYLANLRTAKASLLYTLSGIDLGDTHQPFSTYFGFRYCELTADDDIEVIDIYGLPISSQVEESGSIFTNNESVNQLYSNIKWGQRGNFVSIPTDCPQRNERYGWTGDAQAFSRTGMYNAPSEAFYRKYLADLRDSQDEKGSYPDMCPPVYKWYGNAGWGDAGIIIPYNMYLMYGNKDILREHFSSMEKYMEWMASNTEGEYKYQGAGISYGDWLAYDKCDNRYVSVAYYAYDAQLMSYMAGALSCAEDDIYAEKSKYYDQLYESIKSEFNTRYWNPLPVENTQTTYILPLAFNLLDEDKEKQAKELLKKSIDERGGLLSTGFLGTSLYLTTLSKHMLDDLAYNLLLKRDNPSWLYSIDQGATTIWERWDSYTLEKGFGPASMNSFNHYAYGAVAEWMYRYMAGIDCEVTDAGFKHIILRPTLDYRGDLPEGQERVKEVNSSYNSCRGKIRSSWKAFDDGGFEYSCIVPANTTATLYLPVSPSHAEILESNIVASDSEGVSFIGELNNCHIYNLLSGEYHFHTRASTDGIKVLEDETELSTGDNKEILVKGNIRELTLYNLGGKIIRKIRNKKLLNISGIAAGAYLLNIKSDVSTKTYKILIL